MLICGVNQKRLSKEYRQKAEKVMNFVLHHPESDLSLEALAELVNYSPFHFQKIFKQVVGESPKQYVIKMRLETAAHYLIIHRDRSIMEIAMDCGFSSPAVFSRAFKNYFTISADEFRGSPQSRKSINPTGSGHLKHLLKPLKKRKRKINNSFPVAVKSMTVISGICLNTDFTDVKKIGKTLKDVITLAKAHDLYKKNSKVIGIMYPHHNIYKAFVSIDQNAAVSKRINKAEIKAGKYASFKIKGSIHDTFQKITSFYHDWLPENGYKLADIFGFEVFPENAFKNDHEKCEREIFVPIEPV